MTGIQTQILFVANPLNYRYSALRVISFCCNLLYCQAYLETNFELGDTIRVKLNAIVLSCDLMIF